MRAAITAILVILGAAACMRSTVREPAISETKTSHVRGTPFQDWPALGERR
jgi:hypothetical protein